MTTSSLVQDLKERRILLSNLYLDPNNPRFVEQDWNYISDDLIADESVQELTRQRMIRDHGVEKLKMNMEINGYLPIDRIIVRQFDDEKYVVLEGNRRICAAKTISHFTIDGAEVNPEVVQSLREIPCLQYVGEDSKAAWLFQGLRHITGYEDWSAFNKAKLLVEQMEDEDLNLTTVGKRFGLSAFGAGQWVRGYYAFRQAKSASDYVIEVDEKSYPYFQELFSRSNSRMREWMEWKEGNGQYEFLNTLNFNEFVGWLYPRNAEAGDDENSSSRGEWDRRALKIRDDIRQLSFLLQEDPEAFEVFRREKDIEKAYAQAMTKKFERKAREGFDPSEQVFIAINECTRALDNLPLKIIKNDASRTRFFEAIQKLEAVIESVK